MEINHDIYILIHCLHEEWLSGDGHFKSMETDTMFRNRFCDWDETPKDAFKNLLKKYNLSESYVMKTDI